MFLMYVFRKLQANKVQVKTKKKEQENVPLKFP